LTKVLLSFGQKMLAARSKVYKEIGLARGASASTQQIRVLQPHARRRHRLLMQTDNNGVCSNDVVVYW